MLTDQIRASTRQNIQGTFLNKVTIFNIKKKNLKRKTFIIQTTLRKKKEKKIEIEEKDKDTKKE